MRSLIFDDRLITAARLLDLAGEHGLQQRRDALHQDALECRDCGQVIEVLSDRYGDPYPFTAGQLLQDVLRHLVMRHEVSLSGRENSG